MLEQLGIGERDNLASVGERKVVMQHEHPVARLLHVELDPIEPGLERPTKSGERVLGQAAAHAAMADQQRALAAHAH